MRKSFFIAALVAASATGAHAQVACRGDTISELNECIAAATPEAPEPVEETTTPTTGPTTTTTTGAAARVTLGGALEPTNLRAAPPRAAPPLARVPVTDPETAVPGLTPESTDAARSPSATEYGGVGPAARASRSVLGTPAIGTRTFDDYSELPRRLDTR